MPALQWRQVDEGWGRRAVDEATLHEPQNVREYVALHERLGVGDGTRLLDVACGSGLAAELATARGATVAAIDASERLVDVAKDRMPTADIRVGDMCALPWADGSFDVVTSFRGIWGTTPEALDEVRRVLTPGGLLGMTVWGHLKVSPGAWSLLPFTWASTRKVRHQAAMNALGKPGIGEALLHEHGFTEVDRVRIPCVWEFADPELFARALASTGPAYEAIQSVGEEKFLDDARELAAEYVREGLPLRAEIDLVGFLARTPRTGAVPGYLSEPSELTEAAERLYADDIEHLGYVMNASRLWAHDADALAGIFDLLDRVTQTASLSIRERGVLVTTAAASIGDAYCSLSWGTKLAAAASPEISHGVLTGEDALLDDRERSLARWARAVSTDANGVTAADVEQLRKAGYDDAQILAITTYVALRVAFATVNDALGCLPDAQLATSVPAQVLEAVRFGRPLAPLSATTTP